jgi:hypothetical protein
MVAQVAVVERVPLVQTEQEAPQVQVERVLQQALRVLL